MGAINNLGIAAGRRNIANLHEMAASCNVSINEHNRVKKHDLSLLVDEFDLLIVSDDWLPNVNVVKMLESLKLAQ